jgi:cell cycle checkpoint protein
MAPYDTRIEMLEELTATQMKFDEAEMDMSSQAEEEALDHASHGWDMEDEVVVEEKGWLEEDDIEDFD